MSEGLKAETESRISRNQKAEYFTIFKQKGQKEAWTKIWIHNLPSCSPQANVLPSVSSLDWSDI